MDDDDDWVTFLTKQLTGEGFLVEGVSSSAEAQALCVKHSYHVAVLDIQLQDADQRDRDGMTLLRALDERGIPRFTNIVMLSAHGDVKLIADVLVTYRAAHFLSKYDFDLFTFVNYLGNLLSPKNELRPINLGLTIHWQEIGDRADLVNDLEIAGIPMRSSQDLGGQEAFNELEDLLCRMYFDADEIIATPLVAGRSGAGVLKVRAIYHDGNVGRTEVVKFGDVGPITKEVENFGQYVGRFVGTGRITSLRTHARTLHLGGICYSLVGAGVEDVKDLVAYYQQNSAPRVARAFERLFEDTCAHWYASRSKLGTLDLSADYARTLGFTEEKVGKAIAQLTPSILSETGLGDVAAALERLAKSCDVQGNRPSHKAFTYSCTTHGDLNAHNVLTDSAGNGWLIDFERTGPSHILRDVTQLDSVVRFQLMGPQDVSLADRLALEKMLLHSAGSRHGHSLSGVPTSDSLNAQVAKALAVVTKLRTIAGKMIAARTISGTDEYRIALYYNAINFIRFDWAPLIQRQHALLSACVLDGLL